jgi:hypothetical protein
VRKDEKQEDYLAKAREADQMAERANGALTRDAWRRIAQNYRTLAGAPDEGGTSGSDAPVPGGSQSR